MKHYNIPIFINHTGCPNMCVFCNQDKINGADVESSIINCEKIIEENLLTIKENSNIEVAFFGGSFTGIKIETQEKLLKSVQKYIEIGRIKGIRVSTRPDYINEEIIELLKRNKVTTIELGVQSFDSEVLVKSKRGHTRESIFKAADIIKKAGIDLGIQLMPGLPGSDFFKEIEDTKLCIKIKPSQVRIYPTIVISKTELEEMYNKGLYKPLTIEEAIDISVFMTSMFELNGINIIRTGLAPSDELRSDGNIVSGPFHPAFKELVEGEIIYKFLKEILDDNKENIIYVCEQDVSRVVGIGKSNLKKLQNKNITVKINRDLQRGLIMTEKKVYCREEILKNIIK